MVSPPNEGVGDGRWAAITVGAAKVLLWFEGAGDGRWEPMAKGAAGLPLRDEGQEMDNGEI